MKAIKCSECGSNSFAGYGTLPDGRLIFTCASCGTQFVDEKPKPIETKELKNASLTGHGNTGCFEVYGTLTMSGHGNKAIIITSTDKIARPVRNLEISGFNNTAYVILTDTAEIGSIEGFNNQTIYR